MSFLTLQLQKLQLSGAGATSTETSITLESMKLIDGTTDVTMAMFGGDIGYITLEPATSKEEQISFTGITQNASGTATLTGVVRGLGFQSPYAETSANKKSHSGSVTCVVSNTSAFYSQFSMLKNDDTYTGTKTHTEFPVKSGTPTPTAAAQFATKAYVDAVGAGTAVYDQNIIEAIAGESLVAGDPVYFKASDQKWWKTNGSAAATSINVKIGIAQSTAAADASVNVLIGGLDKTQAGMTPGAPQYIGDTDGTLVETPGTFEKFVGWAVDATDLMLSIETVTADEKDALAATSGITPDINNKYVDNADTTIAAVQTAATIAFVDSNPDTITDSGSGFLTAGFKVGDAITISGSGSNDGTYTIAAIVAGTITLVSGDSLAVEGVGATVTITAAIASKVLRLNTSGELPPVSAANLTNVPVGNVPSLNNGFTSGEAIDGSTTPQAVMVDNAASAFSDTLESGASSGSADYRIDSASKALYQSFFMPADGYNRLKSIDLTVTKGGAPDNDWQMDVYAVDGSHKPTGASLGTTTQVMDAVATGGLTMTFSTEITLTPGVEYACVITPINVVTLDGANYHAVDGDNAGGDDHPGYSAVSTDGGSTWGTVQTDDISFVWKGGFIGSASGRIVRTGASNTDRLTNVIGFTANNIADAIALTVTNNGVMAGFTGLTVGVTYYLSDTLGGISSSAGSTKIKIGVAVSTTEILIQIQELDANL